MRTITVMSIVWLLGAAVAAGQATPPKPQMAEEAFTNVQILKGIPVDEFMGTMGFFSASLGLNCTDCHVDESGGNWKKYADETPLKQTARRMMQMVASLNRASFGGRQMVTCNTCHRGTSRPNVMPSIALLYGAPPPDEPGEPFTQAPGQPSADQVLDRYVQAIGGRELLRDELAQRGMTVDVVPVSQTVERALGDPPPAFDVATFASPSALRAFVRGRGEDGRQALASAIVAAIGPTTADAAAVLGVRVDVVPPAPSMAALIDALAVYRRQHN